MDSIPPVCFFFSGMAMPLVNDQAKYYKPLCTHNLYPNSVYDV